MTEIDFAVSVGARESRFSRFDFGSAPRGASRIQYGGQQISMVEFKLLAKVISTLGEAAQGGEDARADRQRGCVIADAAAQERGGRVGLA